MFFFGEGGNSFISNCVKKSTNKYFNFGQLLLSSVVNIGKLLYKQATSYSLFEPSQTPLGQSKPNLITIRFKLLRFACNWSQRQLFIYEPSISKINEMTCAPCAVTCAYAQSDWFSLFACRINIKRIRNLGALATHRVRSKTDQTANIHIGWTLLWAPSHFVGFVRCWLIWLTLSVPNFRRHLSSALFFFNYRLERPLYMQSWNTECQTA